MCWIQAEQAQTALNNASAEVSKQEAVISQATNDLSAAQTSLSNVTAQLSNAQDVLTQANAALSRAQTAKSSAQSKVDAAQKAYDAAKAKADAAEQKIKDGAFAFYETMAANGDAGAQEALKILTDTNAISEHDQLGKALSSYTKRGDKNDATSLEHMKASMDYIKECNELRVNDPIKKNTPLLVNDIFMAYAQVDANAASYYNEHPDVFNCGENLAFGFMNGRDPFDAWYTHEKENYESKNGKTIGHYLNIINNANTVTGFAISTYNGKNY